MSRPSSFQQVARDIWDLVELQMQLWSVDSQVAKGKLISALATGIAAATLGGSTLSLALIAAGFLLHEYTVLSLGWSLLIVSGVCLLIVIGLLLLALRSVNKAGAALHETKSELNENIKWLKATLLAPSSSPRNQIRRESFPDRDPHFPSDYPSSRATSPNRSAHDPHATVPLQRR